MPQPKSKSTKLVRPLWNYLDPFRVGGLAALCVLLDGALWGTKLVVYSRELSIEHL